MTVSGNTGVLGKTGCTFSGWNTQADGNGTNYAPGDTFLRELDNITLYAKWIQHTYTIDSISNQTLEPLNEGYQVDTQEERIITVTKKGTGILTNLTAALSGENPESFIITQFPAETLDSATTPTVLGLKAKNGLATGTYTAVIMITADNMTPVEFLITQVVNAPGAPAIPFPPTNLSAFGGNKKVNLTWSGSSGATHYKVYTSTVSGSYGEEFTTVSGSVYGCEMTGLTNGTTYYFVIKASNDGGESQNSAEVSAVPMTVPGVPTEVTATSGNQQATVTFAEPLDNGGSAITEYIVTSNPGNIIVSGTGTTITVTGLVNGTSYTFTVKAVNEKGSSPDSTPSNAVTPVAPSCSNDSNNNSDDSSDSDNSDNSNDQTNNENSNIEVIINGKQQVQGASATIAKEGDKLVTTITLDQEKLDAILNTEGNNSKLVLSVTKNTDKVIGEFNGQMVKNMEVKNAVVEIRTESAGYSLPAQQINIDDVSNKIGQEVELQDIKVNIEIARSGDETVKIIEGIAKQKEYTIVSPPINFTITCHAKGKTIEVSKFNAYVERLVAIPDDIDPKMITTGIVLNDDGSISHVPTVITVIDGKYYARINSLSNSTYTVINNVKTMTDVENHWSKIIVNDMASRLIIESADGLNYGPEEYITRADFINIVVRALALRSVDGNAIFSDVEKDEWFYNLVNTTFEHEIIKGYDDGTFKPLRQITREEAMVIIAKALQIAGSDINITEDGIAFELNKFIDGKDVDDWSKESVAICIKNSIVSGYGNAKLEVNANITRAETATIIRNILIQTNLIDDITTRKQ